MNFGFRPLRMTVLGLLVVLVQVSLVSPITVFGVRADVVLLLTIAASLVGGAEPGATVGFLAGLTIDAFLQTPFGLSALVYCLLGYGIGSFQDSVLRATGWIPVGFAFLASVIAVVGYAFIGEVLGQDSFVELGMLRTALVVAVINGAFIVPMLALVRHMAPEEVRGGGGGLGQYR